MSEATSIEWPRSITVGDLERIREKADVDLLTFIDADESDDTEKRFSAWHDMHKHPGILLNVLCIWINVDDIASLKDKMTGAAVKAGLRALEDALGSFYMDWSGDPMFRMASEKIRQLEEIKTEILSKRYGQAFDTLTHESFGKKFGDSQASVESTHGPSRSGS